MDDIQHKQLYLVKSYILSHKNWKKKKKKVSEKLCWDRGGQYWIREVIELDSIVLDRFYCSKQHQIS